jgi:hypothetical protein
MLKVCDYSRTWYHGSPLDLKAIHEGSTITQYRKLAVAFSHKPTILSVSDTGEIRHNGWMPGFLYRITSDIRPEDVIPHPRSSMEWGKEWITGRALSVILVGPTQIGPTDQLSEEEIRALRQRQQTGRE